MEAIKHIELLGLKAKDIVTGFCGVITNVGFDLFGCVQVILTPPIKEDGGKNDSRWLDITRLEVSKDDRVMKVPDFKEGYIARGEKGAGEKTLPAQA